MKFSTALRQGTRRRLERLQTADIVIGIPCFNNDSTLSHVVKTVENGLTLHYPDKRCVVFVADGGSVDDSREEGEDIERSPWVERIISIYRGVPGKGTAVRAIFEAANLLQAKATLLFDSDLRSITPEWVKSMIDAIINDGVDFIAPYYTRYKYDGTITNNIVYNLTRTLYGYQVRQPIGGDFAFSLPLIKKYLPKEDWETDVAKFGIDIWLTTTAMVHKVKIAQANLGVKIHDVKDPAESLGPMFRQVVGTLLLLMEEYEDVWLKVKGSKKVPIVGPDLHAEPQPFEINVQKLVDDFKIGYGNWKELWQKIINKESWKVIEKLTVTETDKFLIETEHWARILYDLAAAFHHWKGNRQLLISLMTPLYFARVASFVNRTKNMSNTEAEKVVEIQAEVFETNKKYLVDRWNSDIKL
ncbi:MAG: glycosyltransferase [Calditrichaceae bacterium]|nr:glycosyltransferase [Calditrichaceae bacterium]MBN2710306.1 glycosyltransferase [Calditrichaceae bacterium]RQV93008.1 MAG: glycosyltransferase [Calditrichota bacterium]